MQMTVNERIKKAMEFYGINKNQLAVAVNVSPTVIGNIVGGRLSSPSFELLEKFLLKFDKISAEWIIHGNGDMLKREQSTKEHQLMEVRESMVKYGHCAECKKKDEIITRLEKQIDSFMALLASNDAKFDNLLKMLNAMGANMDEIERKQQRPKAS
jgi:transcriptional regulator with XRE-family HTH domain